MMANIEITEQEADKLATILNIAIKSQGLVILDDINLFVNKLRTITFTEPQPVVNNENKIENNV